MVFFDSQIHSLYNFIHDFLGNPILYKIKDLDGQSLFGIKIVSENPKEKMFIICKSSYQVNESSVELKNLGWTTLQTRKITDRSEYDNLPEIVLQRNFTSKLKEIEILKFDSTNDNIVEYRIPRNDRVKISLLHSEEYYVPEKTNLQYLINLFDCIVFIEKKK